MESNRRWFGRLMAVLCSVSLLAPAQAQNREPITIPIITPLSGAGAVLGQDIQKGVALGVEHINAAGGIKSMGGRPLRIEVVDTQGKPEIARVEMERLAVRNNAPMVLGGEISAGTGAAAQFAETYGLPFVNSAAANSDLLQRGYKWYFTEQITNEDEAATWLALLKHLAEKAGGAPPTVAFLYEDSPRGAGSAKLAKKLVEAAGFKVVADVSYNRAERNLLTHVAKVQQAKPEVLMWAGYTEDVAAGLKAMQQLNFTPYILGAGGGPGDPRMPELVGAAFVDKVHLSTVDYFAADSERAKRFVVPYTKQYGQVPSSYASIGYRAAFLAKAVLEKAGKLDRAAIRSALQGLNIPGSELISPFKSVQFAPDGRNLGAQNAVTQWQDGRKSTVWPPEIAVKPPAPLRGR